MGNICGMTARSDSFEQPDFRITGFVGSSFAVVPSGRFCAVTDYIVYGRIAGRNAAKETPWR